ncbi:MAG: hypothetical protein WBP85_11150 [Terracidiphilus sp.]
MKWKFSALLLCACLVPMAQARDKNKTPLPDACGDENAKFDVKLQSNPSASLTPDPGKALIVFIDQTQHFKEVIRFAIDGTWVGANYGNSYFTVAVAPGEHNLCGAFQRSGDKARSLSGMTNFTAEAGKIYYWESVIGNLNYQLAAVPADAASLPGPSTPPRSVGNGVIYVSYRFLTEQQGKYALKTSELAGSSPKK